jgi:hypothetical protein
MKRIEIRLNDENNDLLEAVAAADNVPVSAWIIQQALSVARRHPTGRSRAKAIEVKAKADAKAAVLAAKVAEERLARIPHYEKCLENAHMTGGNAAETQRRIAKHCEDPGFADWYRSH